MNIKKIISIILLICLFISDFNLQAFADIQAIEVNKAEEPVISDVTTESAITTETNETQAETEEPEEKAETTGTEVIGEEETLYYTVEYYKDSVEDWNLLNNEVRTISTINPVVDIDDISNVAPFGYELDEENSTSLPFTVTADNNVIKVCYVYKIDAPEETVDVTVSLIWEDEDVQNRQDVSIFLYANENKVNEVTLTNEATSFGFENLPKYDSEGMLIQYTVTGDTVENYDSFIEGPYEDYGVYFFNLYYTYVEPDTTVNYTVNYLEVGTNKVLTEPKVVTGQTVGTLVKEFPLDIEGYEPEKVWVDGGFVPKSASIALTEDENIIIFLYTEAVKDFGTVVVRYEDENGNELLPEVMHSKLDLGEHTFNAPEIEGYTANENSQTTTLTYDGDIKYIVFSYTENEKEQVEEEPIEDELLEEAQLRVILADCTDIQDLKPEEAFEILRQRSENEEHNIIDERYFNLAIGKNIIEIPTNIGELEWQITGSYWDSRIDRKFLEDEQGNRIGIEVYVPFFTNLNLYVGYIYPEKNIEKPEEGKKTARVEKEEQQLPQLNEIKQEDFVARWLNHKPISKVLKRFNKGLVKYEVSSEQYNELRLEGLEPRIYVWNKEKGKLVAEVTTTIEESDKLIIKHDSIKDPSNYYAVFAVKQPKFEDINEKHNNFSIIDKANGLGLIEGIDKDGERYFEASKDITKSEFCTIVARIFGAVPDGEMKMYKLIDLKTMKEADEALEGIETEIDDWAKPYIVSLLDEGYIVISDLQNNQFNFSRDFELVNKLFKAVENKQSSITLTEGNTREDVIKALIELLEEYGW